MKRSRKSNRVSWASGFNLSQVKLFLPEDSPSKVGMEVQNHLHGKPSWMSHPHVTESNDLPPGFENNHYANMKEKLYHIPSIKWKCPPKFLVSSNWHVAAGEESEEVVVEKVREMRVMEAIYPHNSAIPPSPIVSVETKDESYDDHLTPVIPIIPIEEVECSEIPSDLRMTPNINPVTSMPTPNINLVTSVPSALPQALLASGTRDASETLAAKEKPVIGMSHGLGSDLITAAASAALTAAMKSNEIDTQLLIQIFSDPKMIEKLTKDCGAVANAGTMTTANMVSLPISGPPQATQVVPSVSAPASALKPATQPIPLVNKPKPDMVQPQRSVNGKVGHLANGMPLVFTSAPAQPATGSVSVGSKPVNHPATRSGPEHNMVPLPGMGIENKHKTQQNQVNLIPNMMPGSVGVPKTIKTCPVKDANYYKNLIRQHGGDNQESHQFHYGNLPNNQFQNMEMMQRLNAREAKPRNPKPCAYFNSPRGCRNGANCIFKHEITLQNRGGRMMEVQNGKRMRFGGEIVGRT